MQELLCDFASMSHLTTNARGRDGSATHLLAAHPNDHQRHTRLQRLWLNPATSAESGTLGPGFNPLRLLQDTSPRTIHTSGSSDSNLHLTKAQLLCSRIALRMLC